MLKSSSRPGQRHKRVVLWLTLGDCPEHGRTLLQTTTGRCAECLAEGACAAAAAKRG